MVWGFFPFIPLICVHGFVQLQGGEGHMDFFKIWKCLGNAWCCIDHHLISNDLDEHFLFQQRIGH